MRALLRFLLLLLVFVSGALALARLEVGQSGFHVEGEGGQALAAAVEPRPEGEEPDERDGPVLGRLNIVSKVIGYVRTKYVDPARVKPVPMLVSSLKRLQGEVTELMVRPEGDDEDAPTALVVRAGDAEKRFPLDKVSDLYRLNWVLVDIFQFLAEQLPGGALDEDAEYTAAAGLVRALDPHSTMMDPEAYAEMKVGTYGKFGGLGIVISIRKARLVILSVIEDTPAATAGLKKGDHIAQIGDESTINMALDEAVQRMRGEPGTSVTLVIDREGFKEPRSFSMVRALIRVKSVVSKRLDKDVAYVRIKNFNSNTTAGLMKALKGMSSPRAVKGMVLDLRGDPGGLLSQAIRVSDLLLAEGTIVTTVGQAGTQRDEKGASPGDAYEDLPVVVLVDEASASASEIVAGALKYSGRGLLLGERTFGKATVQELYEIAEGALKLTVAQYLTPGDVLIQNVGVSPDVAMVAVHVDDDETAVYAHELERFGEKDLPGALEGSGSVPTDPPAVTIKYVEELPPEDADDDYDAVVVDPPIELARDLLAGAGDASAERFLARAEGLLRRAGARHEARVVARLAERGVAWQSGAAVPAPRLEASLDTDPPGAEVQAGEDLTLVLRVTNQGDAPIHRVHALLDADWSLLDEREIVIGALKPGETREGRLRAEVPGTVQERLEHVSARLFQEYDAIAEPAPERDLTVRARPRPDFALQVLPGGAHAPILYDDRDLRVLVRVQNRGSAMAEAISVTLTNKSGDKVLLKRGRETREKVAVGAVIEAEFDVHRNGEAFDGPLEFLIGAYDQQSGRYVSVPFAIAPPAPERAPVAASGAVRLEGAAQALALPDPDAPPVGTLAAGSVLRVVARAGDLVGVWLDRQGAAAWVAASATQPFDGAAEGAYELTDAFPFAAPEIRVTVRPPLSTDAERVRVEGEVVFPSTFLAESGDLMAWRDSEKVYFERVPFERNQARTAPFAFEATLAPGRNRVRLTARVGDKVKSVENLYVYREGGPVSAPPKSPHLDLSHETRRHP